MRALGVDLGSKRIGVALCDEAETVATPLCTIERTRDADRVYRQLCGLVDEYQIEVLVVGSPRHLDGRDSPSSRAVGDYVRQLRKVVTVPIVQVDERLTTVVAHKSLDQMGVSSRVRNKMVDQLAAAAILQSWIDRRRDAPDPEEPFDTHE